MKYSVIKIFIIFVFLFINNIFLPFGLQYTTLLSPLFFFYSCTDHWKPYVLGLFFFAFFFVLHYIGKITAYPDYFRSAALHFSVLIICVSFYKMLKSDPEVLYKAFDKAVIINFLLTVVAVMLLYSGNTDLWQTAITSGAFANLPRLRLFTYEPSYYSTLLAPIFLYYFVRLIQGIKGNNLFPLALICIPLFLSLSFGVLFSLIITILLVNLISLKKRTIMIFAVSGFLIFGGAIFLFLYNPNSPIILRVINIVAGTDVSGDARLFDSWTLAFEILKKHHSYFTGVGWGQLPIVGHDLIQAFYNYSDSDTTAAYTIPNFVCEVLAINGILGIAFFLFLQIYFYRKTNVKNSVYRKYIFWFIFIYQFTGGYSSSVIEYALFVIAFYKPMDLYFIKYKRSVIKKVRKKKAQLNYDINLV